MKRIDIARLVSEKASRFGEQNAQEVRFLLSRLRSEDTQEVLAGLIHVFTHGESAPSGSAAQELAGRLLQELRPAGHIELESVIRQALPRYELSVEQFPWHLAHACGKSRVLEALDSIASEELSSESRRALEAMAFWLKAAES